jgi:hypothetical protein
VNTKHLVLRFLCYESWADDAGAAGVGVYLHIQRVSVILMQTDVNSLV